MSKPKDKATLYIGGIADHITAQNLLDAFSTFGDVVDVQIPEDPSGKMPNRGFAFLEFSDPKDAQAAIDNMHLNELEGKTLRLNIAKAINRAAVIDPKRAIWTQEGYAQEYGDEKETNDNAATEGNMDVDGPAKT